MLRLPRNKIFAMIGLILMISAAGISKSRTQRVTNGVWGGEHIRIEVQAKSATVEYDCANGTIEGPLTVDRQGRFKWHGIHYRERGGPVRQGEQPAGQPATYTGSIKAGVMTLNVKLGDSDEPFDTFKLRRGNPGNIFKCR